jgi:hypothetical protein
MEGLFMTFEHVGGLLVPVEGRGTPGGCEWYSASEWYGEGYSGWLRDYQHGCLRFRASVSGYQK